MLDVGKSSIFSHPNQKGWSDVLVKRASHHLHVFCVTATPLNNCRLFSLALLAIWYALIHDHRDDKHENISLSAFFIPSLSALLHPSSSSFVSPSFNPHIVCANGWRKGGTLISCPAQSPNEKSCPRGALWGATLDLSLLSGFPSSRREILESRLTVTSAAVALASCPHVLSWTSVSLLAHRALSVATASTEHGSLHRESPWSQ